METWSVEIETQEVTRPDVAVSPDGEWLIFTALGHLFRLPVEGGAAQQLTFGPYFDSDPAISPDGRYVVFATITDANKSVAELAYRRRSRPCRLAAAGLFSASVSPGTGHGHVLRRLARRTAGAARSGTCQPPGATYSGRDPGPLPLQWWVKMMTPRVLRSPGARSLPAVDVEHSRCAHRPGCQPDRGGFMLSSRLRESRRRPCSPTTSCAASPRGYSS